MGKEIMGNNYLVKIPIKEDDREQRRLVKFLKNLNFIHYLPKTPKNMKLMKDIKHFEKLFLGGLDE